MDGVCRTKYDTDAVVAHIITGKYIRKRERVATRVDLVGIHQTRKYYCR